jgi:hypothetical protein
LVFLRRGGLVQWCKRHRFEGGGCYCYPLLGFVLGNVCWFHWWLDDRVECQWNEWWWQILVAVSWVCVSFFIFYFGIVIFPF